MGRFNAWSMMHEPEYAHTRWGPWSTLLAVLSVAFTGAAWLTRDEPTVLLGLVAAGLITGILAATFHRVTVADDGERLLVRFGPLPLFRPAIRYADIVRVETRQPLLLDGWGIHYSARGGWVGLEHPRAWRSGPAAGCCGWGRTTPKAWSGSCGGSRGRFSGRSRSTPA